jgi:GT2 family glycosyltransferase
MSHLVDATTCVIIPNWNGAEGLRDCLDSLINQTLKPYIIVVDNGSKDESLHLIEKYYPKIDLIRHSKNMGFAGGVNAGFKLAIQLNARYAASLNNDAIADPSWLKKLTDYLDENDQVGIATCKLLTSDGQKLDSTGDYYTVWGLPYPRGRGESDINKYDHQTEIFGASGGASVYRVKMLEDIGMFDEDFFAYYEDVDLSFRAQLAGWKVSYVPEAKAYHQIGATSGRIKGFTVYQTMKNLQLLMYKNVPKKYRFRVYWRFKLASSLFFLRAISRGAGWVALKGTIRGNYLIFRARSKRQQIQKSKQVSDEYIWQLFVHDLPPNAHALRMLRNRFYKIIRKGSV